MKWLLRIIGGLAALVVVAGLALFIAGKRENAGRNAARVEIDRPPAQVFRHLIQPELVSKWISNVASFQWSQGRAGEKGARAHLVMEVDGKRYELDQQVTEVDPTRRLLLSTTLVGEGAETEGFTQSSDYVLREKNGKTELTMVLRTEFKSALHRFLEPILSSAEQGLIEADLARLELQVEAEPREGPAVVPPVAVTAPPAMSPPATDPTAAPPAADPTAAPPVSIPEGSVPPPPAPTAEAVKPETDTVPPPALSPELAEKKDEAEKPAVQAEAEAATPNPSVAAPGSPVTPEAAPAAQ